MHSQFTKRGGVCEVSHTVVDNFETAVRRERTVIIAFSFVKSIHDEAAKAKFKESLDVRLV